ncbi:pantothenate kinase [Ranunculus cassubicifolius]
MATFKPELDLTGAAIHGNSDELYPTIVLPNQSHHISLLGIDIGGTLIKLVYISRDDNGVSEGTEGERLGVKLHFVKFQTREINECMDFISSNQLHCSGVDREGSRSDVVIKATGGGAYRFADMFKERLGVSIIKGDEMDCLVSGANFFLKAIQHEAFTHMEGQKKFVQIDHNDLFPYLLVNIGSGVSMLKVHGDGKFERVTGSMIGGGTYLGLGMLLTNCKSFDELLEMSKRGDNKNVDMLVGDIYGGKDYAKIGLAASAVASSFGKTISEIKELKDYRPEDISLALLKMVTYNTGHIAHLVSRDLGLKRIFFGGFFIRGHACTMDIMSKALHYWSKGKVQALFLRHEGFLGALGAFMSHHVEGGPSLNGPSPGDFSAKASDEDDDDEALLAELEAKMEQIKKRMAEKKLQKEQ